MVPVTQVAMSVFGGNLSDIQLTAVQTNLMQADIPAVSTQLSLTASQQAALINVISALGSGSLFDKLQA